MVTVSRCVCEELVVCEWSAGFPRPWMKALYAALCGYDAALSTLHITTLSTFPAAGDRRSTGHKGKHTSPWNRCTAPSRAKPYRRAWFFSLSTFSVMMLGRDASLDVKPQSLSHTHGWPGARMGMHCQATSKLDQNLLSEKSPSVPLSPLPFSMTVIDRLDYSLLG